MEPSARSKLLTTGDGPSYNKLFQLIEKEMRQGLDHIRDVVEQQGVVTAWRIGQHLGQNLLPEKGRRIANARVIKRLARDFNRTPRHFYNMAKFYRMYPDESPKTPLTWSHYIILVRVPDAGQRRVYEKMAIREKLIWKDMQSLILKDKKNARHARLLSCLSGKRDIAQLTVERGQLYHYKVSARNARQPAGKVFVDAGFTIQREVALAAGMKVTEGSYVRTAKSDEIYLARMAGADATCLYTYQAFVERVVDGDTMVADIDCGLRTSVFGRRLRLRGIDTPEMDTPLGHKAKAFVQTAMRKVDFVIIKTHKIGLFGRDISDVFYLPGEKDPATVAAKGRFLNQELLDKRLAVIA